MTACHGHLSHDLSWGEVRLELGGLPTIVLDTAGLRRAPADEVEAGGIHEAHHHDGYSLLLRADVLTNR